MGLVTLIPLGNSTPWPAFGGSAVSSPTNQGHGMTTVDAPFFPASDQVKTALWGGFPALPGTAITARLKGSWTYQNADYDDEMSGDLGQISSENIFQLFYNLTGSSDTNLNSIVGISNVLGGDSGTFDIGISLGQNMANLHVMDILRAVSDGTGANDAHIEVQISSIRVEVVTRDIGNLLSMM